MRVVDHAQNLVNVLLRQRIDILIDRFAVFHGLIAAPDGLVGLTVAVPVNLFAVFVQLVLLGHDVGHFCVKRGLTDGEAVIVIVLVYRVHLFDDRADEVPRGVGVFRDGGNGHRHLKLERAAGAVLGRIAGKGDLVADRVDVPDIGVKAVHPGRRHELLAVRDAGRVRFPHRVVNGNIGGGSIGNRAVTVTGFCREGIAEGQQLLERLGVKLALARRPVDESRQVAGQAVRQSRVLRPAVREDRCALLQLCHGVLHGGNVPRVVLACDGAQRVGRLHGEAGGQLIELAVLFQRTHDLWDKIVAAQAVSAVHEGIEVGDDALGGILIDWQIAGQEDIRHAAADDLGGELGGAGVVIVVGRVLAVVDDIDAVLVVRLVVFDDHAAQVPVEIHARERQNLLFLDLRRVHTVQDDQLIGRGVGAPVLHEGGHAAVGEHGIARHIVGVNVAGQPVDELLLRVRFGGIAIDVIIVGVVEVIGIVAREDAPHVGRQLDLLAPVLRFQIDGDEVLAVFIGGIHVVRVIVPHNANLLCVQPVQTAVILAAVELKLHVALCIEDVNIIIVADVEIAGGVDGEGAEVAAHAVLVVLVVRVGKVEAGDRAAVGSDVHQIRAVDIRGGVVPLAVRVGVKIVGQLILRRIDVYKHPERPVVRADHVVAVDAALRSLRNLRQLQAGKLCAYAGIRVNGQNAQAGVVIRPGFARVGVSVGDFFPLHAGRQIERGSGGADLVDVLHAVRNGKVEIIGLIGVFCRCLGGLGLVDQRIARIGLAGVLRLVLRAARKQAHDHQRRKQQRKHPFCFHVILLFIHAQCP